ncbi:hypothetical protein PInf_023514 [Phytophthora infestans]|nr:hypothetical protein PInf_023514 [Phytophthora infestans]
MDADSDDTEYALRPPSPHWCDTITRQLQREILGEISDDRAQNKPTDASPEHEQKSEEDDPPSTPSKRRTLSPGMAFQIPLEAEVLDAAISRRDTVSPEALKAVIKGAGGLEKKAQKKKSSPAKPRGTLETSEQLEEVLDSPARSTRSKTSSAGKRPSSATKPTSPVKTVEGRRKSTSVVNTSDSFTDTMFAPNLLEKDAARRPTLDPTAAASVVAALRREERGMSMSSSALEMDADSGDDQLKTSSKQVKSSKTSTREKASKQSLSPRKEPVISRKTAPPSKDSMSNKLPATESRKSSSPVQEASTPSKSRKSTSPLQEATTRKAPSPAKDRKSSTPPKDNSKRHATVDLSDGFSTLANSPQQSDDRRDDNGFLILNSGFGYFSAGGEDAADKRGEEASRKRVNVSEEHGGSSEKRTRTSRDGNDATMESMDIDSPLHAGMDSSFSANEQKATGNNNVTSPDELPPSRIPKLSMFSPPPRLRTPLKGILSARKERRNAETTPTKSVNFGPSQGAEFNHGSPSTSMTPMPAKDASRLFPLERVSSEEEPDDAETSLNSSILDKADSLDEEEPEQVTVPKLTQPKKSGFNLLQSRRSSLAVSKSTDKGQRRHSMRGFSPLDSRAAFQRRRRQTINVTRQASKTSSTTSFPAENPATSSQSPSAPGNNSFLRATDITQTTRIPYADSSASSDAGEDMEITGDYSITLGDTAGLQSQSLTGLPREEDTAEFSLGHLLAEFSVHELTKSAPESDLHDLPGSLGDLANEVASQSNHTQPPNDQNTTLDPIAEANETMTSLRNQSAMSLVSDESDDEYAAKRASLQVNLKAQFDRVSEPSQSPRRPPTPEPRSAPQITMEELLSSLDLNEESTFIGAAGNFFGEKTESLKDVVVACAHDTCSAVMERHAQDVSSWSSAVTEELSLLLHAKAPAVLSPENLDDAGREAIQELFDAEALVARTAWCQLQTQMEKQLTASLSVGAAALASDVKSLKDSVAAGVLKRQNELAAIKEMIAREEQMALLLDAIEEQQGAHDDYVKAVKDLEKECSSLSLEESVLQSRLKVLEGRAAELEPVTPEAVTLLRQEVLAAEEMLTIQESLSLWKIREATSSILRLSARFEDVLFDVEVCVDVHLRAPSMGGASTSIKVNESLKQTSYLPCEGDVVLVLQRLLLDPHYISRIADESELGDGIGGRTCSKLQVLENFICRSFRLLKELRELSTHFSMRYDKDHSTLWVDFLKFPSAAARIDVEGAQFSVGFSLLPVFPFTDYQTAVQVSRGQVSTDAVAKEIELVSRLESEYFTRVCRRLHDSFVR